LEGGNKYYYGPKAKEVESNSLALQGSLKVEKRVGLTIEKVNKLNPSKPKACLIEDFLVSNKFQIFLRGGSSNSSQNSQGEISKNDLGRGSKSVMGFKGSLKQS